MHPKQSPAFLVTKESNQTLLRAATYAFPVKDNHGNTRFGKPFHVDPALIKQYSLSSQDYVNATASTIEDFVFVTGVSANHFQQSKDAIAGVQHHFPKKKVLYFDWGLTEDQKADLQKWCNVEVRNFNFSDFHHLASMNIAEKKRYQAAKVFVILTALKEYPAVIWMDASIRLMSHKFAALYHMLERNTGFALLAGGTTASTYAVTPPQMYEYFHPDKRKLKISNNYQSGCMFFTRTKEVYENILRWMLLCCLDPDCIYGGRYPSHCAFMDNRHLEKKTIFSNCTRMDQSLVNMLALAMYKYNLKKFVFTHKLLEVKRSDESMYKVMLTQQDC